MVDKKLKKVSIKFGIICGMLITALSVFNATMDSIQKWNETFKKEELVQEFHFEQRVIGTPPPGTSISKSITSEEFLEEGDLIEPPSYSFNEPKENTWFSTWFIFILVGLFVWSFSFYLGKKFKN